MNAAKPTTRPKRTFDEGVEMAALDALAEPSDDDADGRGLVEGLMLGNVADEVAPALVTATSRS